MDPDDDRGLGPFLDRASESALMTLSVAIDVEQRLREFYDAIGQSVPQESERPR